jgi:hypothetical protein
MESLKVGDMLEERLEVQIIFLICSIQPLLRLAKCLDHGAGSSAQHCCDSRLRRRRADHLD